tara:strand:- start:200 stop:508 length:309 start_codon:yes stop_codon:yes gene_type:complete
MCCALLVACTPQYAHVPSDVISPEEFTKIIIDIRLAEAQQKIYRQKGYYDNDLIDSSYQMIYHLRGVSAEDVERSYTFYTGHPNWMEKISADVIEKLNKMEE